MLIIPVLQDFVYEGSLYKAKEYYVGSEELAENMRINHPEYVGIMSTLTSRFSKQYQGEDLNGKTILIWRSGGIGDVLMVTAVLRYLKKRYPTCQIHFATLIKDVVKNLPYIDQAHSMPFSLDTLDRSNYFIQYQGLIEGGSEQSKVNHAVDLYLGSSAINPAWVQSSDKLPEIAFSDEEKDWYTAELKRLGINDTDYIVGIQMMSSSPTRNYPFDKMRSLIDTLSGQCIGIALIGDAQLSKSADYFKSGRPNIIDATKYSIRQTFIMAQRWNLIIAPDSMMIQVAGALGKPVIGLYGGFRSQNRMKYFKDAIGLDGTMVCSNCCMHDPCPKGTLCMQLISVSDILQSVDYLKFKTTGSHLRFMVGA
jgi:ADP-heptose:LPS heptosyltransferase